METISIQINNPKVKQLLNDLVALKLISIKPSVSLSSMLVNLRKNADTAPSFDDITAEVEQVRQLRNAKKA